MTRNDCIIKIRSINYRYGRCTLATDTRFTSNYNNIMVDVSDVRSNQCGIYAIHDKWIVAPSPLLERRRATGYSTITTIVKKILGNAYMSSTDGIYRYYLNTKNNKIYCGNQSTLFDEDMNIVWHYNDKCQLFVSSLVFTKDDDEMCTYIKKSLFPLFSGAGVKVTIINGPVIPKQRMDIIDINDFNDKVKRGIL